MRIITYILAAIGALAVLAVIFVIIGFFLYSLTPPLKKELSLMPVSYAASQSLDEKIDIFKDNIKSAAKAKVEKDVRLTLTEEEVNSKLIELMAEDKVQLKEVLINFHDDFFWAYAKVDNKGIDAKTAIIAQPDIEEGEIIITVTEFQLGKLPISKSTNERVGKILEAVLKIEDPIDELPLEITGFEIEDGKFIVEGVVEVEQ